MSKGVSLPAVLVAALGACLAAAPALAVDPIFDQSRLHETRLVMDPADWRALRDNFLSNQYYAANISLDGTVIQQVGIRSRGRGSRSGTKPGLKVDFNHYVPGQELRGMKSLVVDNMTQDASMMREPLCFAVFEAMGIAAPQISYTRLTVNDEYWGLYALVEEVRKSFVRSRLDNGEGYLYQYDYAGAYDFSSRGSNSAAYVPLPFQPQTHENNPNPAGLVAFIQAINETSDAAFVSTMSAFLDLDEFIDYIATENALVENDGLVGYDGMNNFYLYQYAGGQRFVFIPWDKDNTLLHPSWPITTRLETNVLTRRLMEHAEPQAKYVAALRRATEFVSPAFLGPRIRFFHEQIRAAALADTHKPYTSADFESAVGSVESIIAARPADILSQLPAASSSSRR